MKKYKLIEFGIEKGIYRWNTIEEFDKMQNFKGRKEAIIEQMAENMEIGENRMGRTSSEEIHIEDVFPKYPWQTLRENMVNYLQQLGSWISLIIGIYGVICLIKSLVNFFLNCQTLRKIGSSAAEIIIYNMNPKGFILKRMDKGKGAKGEDNPNEEEEEPSYNRKALEEIRKSQAAMKQYHELEIPPYTT